MSTREKPIYSLPLTASEYELLMDLLIRDDLEGNDQADSIYSKLCRIDDLHEDETRIEETEDDDEDEGVAA